MHDINWLGTTFLSFLLIFLSLFLHPALVVIHSRFQWIRCFGLGNVPPTIQKIVAIPKVVFGAFLSISSVIVCTAPFIIASVITVQETQKGPPNFVGRICFHVARHPEALVQSKHVDEEYQEQHRQALRLVKLVFSTSATMVAAASMFGPRGRALCLHGGGKQ
jgi:small-conductance mechanosensitive channel